MEQEKISHTNTIALSDTRVKCSTSLYAIGSVCGSSGETLPIDREVRYYVAGVALLLAPLAWRAHVPLPSTHQHTTLLSRPLSDSFPWSHLLRVTVAKQNYAHVFFTPNSIARPGKMGKANGIYMNVHLIFLPKGTTILPSGQSKRSVMELTTHIMAHNAYFVPVMID